MTHIFMALYATVAIVLFIVGALLTLSELADNNRSLIFAPLGLIVVLVLALGWPAIATVMAIAGLSSSVSSLLVLPGSDGSMISRWSHGKSK
jgi:hypothetical protein